MRFLKSVLSLSLLLPSLAAATGSPTISASPVLPSTTTVQSSAPTLPVASPTSATAPVEPAAANTAPAATVQVPVKPGPGAKLGIESCRNNCGFYGLLAGAGVGLIMQHNNHDPFSVVYGLLGGWALGYLTSFFACD